MHVAWEDVARMHKARGQQDRPGGPGKEGCKCGKVKDDKGDLEVSESS